MQRREDTVQTEETRVLDQLAIGGMNKSKRPLPKQITRKKGAKSRALGGGSEVVNRILELVRSGNLRPGDRLPPERELITIFGIGRPGLRESLRSLATLGVIETRHGGGAYITDLDAKRLLAPLDFVLSLTPGLLDDTIGFSIATTPTKS